VRHIYIYRERWGDREWEREGEGEGERERERERESYCNANRTIYCKANKEIYCNANGWPEHVPSSFTATSERRANNLTGSDDFYLTTKATIWP